LFSRVEEELNGEELFINIVLFSRKEKLI